MFYFSFNSCNKKHHLPLLEEASKLAAEECQEDLKWGTVENFDCKRLSSRFNVAYAPTFILYKYKKEVVEYTGSFKVNFMVAFLRTEMKRLKTTK